MSAGSTSILFTEKKSPSSRGKGCAGEGEVETASSDEMRVIADADNHAVHHDPSVMTIGPISDDPCNDPW